ncbi:winged helix-turn-helix domain-containing protein [Natrinema sp. 1APR25-10V2]|uniref:helix-turn-helix transcriptional regulator n=1 Tax=Natrinema sp. 1APR25-10V2 TaxID=2951081 RepID=UPI002876F38A|nr:winged helix-turn-helix domain-containing protein [Natrinema sp. 1APR25-10V2]MDS0476838.1 winged helix-turn-helix domain-containing protein [Natrinema sp. 1APR25-10V2]
MFSDADPLPDGVLEEMAYLSRSENRLRILHVLTQHQYEPRELAEETDVPRSTLRRIVTELVDRGWAERTIDGTYVATPVGELLAAETDRYVGAIQAIQALDSAVRWLPREKLTIGLHHFQDAIIVGPEQNEAVAPDTYATEQLRDTTEFRNLTNIAPTLGFEKVLHDGVLEGPLSTEHVVTPGVISYLCTDVERQDRWQQYLDAGADLYLYDGQIPCNLFILDETVFLAKQQLEGLEYIEVLNEEVFAWAERMIDMYQEDAERLTVVRPVEDR